MSPLRRAADASDEVLVALATAADGDARKALNSLELAVHDACAGHGAGSRTPVVLLEHVQGALNKAALYDRGGDFHYDLISALHKSLRGGDADAALYYACRMLQGGEDPRYLTRRLIRFASEDVGLADATALPQAVAANDAVLAIGMPEAGVCVAQCVIYLARAPKSCAVYAAYKAAMKTCEDEPRAEVPYHIRNAVWAAAWRPERVVTVHDAAFSAHLRPPLSSAAHQIDAGPRLQ